MIVIVYWVVENNLVYFAQKRRLIWIVIVFFIFRVALAWSMIMIVFWAVEINLVYFAQKRWLICDSDSFLGY